MLFGTDYYPEHWSPDRLSVDIQLMKEAGINQVRMAEFAWSLLEPQDNHFDFTWLDEVVNLLGEAGIYTILGTPTAAPPKWLIDLHPEILPIDREGRTRGFGNRHHRCHNNPVFDKYMTRIINRMVKHYKDNSYVRAWQTDNEIGAHDSTYCYCHHCESAFQEWLRIKYISIDTLNKEWGTVFWSQTYNSFESVSLPRFGTIENDKICAFNPGLMLDFKRFSSDAAVDYQNRQIALIKGSTRQLVTHNTMQHLVFDDIDYYEFSKELDIVSLDNYPSPLQFRIKNPAHMHQAAAFCLDHTRGLKGKNFWIMEQQSGRPGWNLCFGNTTSGQIRLWSHQATAHGAEGLMYFRWRASTIGAEQYWYGILDHDGIPRDRYEEIRKTGKELQGISDLIEASSNTSVIAIITDYDNIWGHKLTPHAFGFSYNELLLGYYTSLVNLHYNVDIVSTDADLSNYELVIAPALNIVDENLRTKLEDYCSKGGHLLLTFLSGTRHKNNSITTQSFPGYFKDLCGITVTDYDPFVRNTLMTDGTEHTTHPSGVTG